MNTERVLKELGEKYPGKNIILNPPENPTEIVCEIDPPTSHPDYSVAVAVIDQSIPHSHNVTCELYRIMKGNLKLTVGGRMHCLREGDEYTIVPGKTHHAEGNETWVKATSRPGWTPSDHILVEGKKL